MSSANRVIKNTGFLYAKMGITMFISLATTRLVLNALGAADFGIFNVVGGAIAMLGFLHAAMSTATQRFMSFYEGKGEKDKQKHIFNVSLVLHFLIAIGLGLILLVAGYFFFNGVLNIAPDRIYAAKVVYGSLIVSTMFTVMSVPYEAVLNAHENMLYYSIVGVIESLLKLAVALIVVNYVGDKLELYGLLTACIPLLVLTVMRIYCHKKYSECVLAPKKYWEPILMKEMTSFAGWNLFGTASGMISQYGIGIVLNTFYGTILNAAHGIANQLSGQLMAFSNNMMKAVNPVIVKSEGGGNRDKMLKTSLFSAKLSFLMLAFFAIPFMIETPYILKIWLKNVPPWAILFVRLQLFRSLIEQLTIMIGRTISAQGNIRNFMKIKSILNVLPIVLTYLLFIYDFPPFYMYVVWILCWGVFGGCVTLYFANRNCGLSYQSFYEIVFKPVLLLFLIITTIGCIASYCMEPGILRLFIVTVVTCVSFVLLYVLRFSSELEKKLFRSLLKKIFKNRYK
ncbi:MATE family efflux transporter [Zunongwangia atlantica]|uniref:Flippase n=1 Tax=Zunongwangia atlantica 22II14-10F7 TaxID=1185767 RepID=A0A1Y1SYB5_9FLAO|nr:hypothetical protein [Zunongwangia atlantica]ORL43740.1 flippase [Zunongwangia atlantica 22II14-10F7]